MTIFTVFIDRLHVFTVFVDRLRHVGDLGNVRQRRRDGKIYTRIVDYVAQLDGPLSIIGRGIAVCIYIYACLFTCPKLSEVNGNKAAT